MTLQFFFMRPKFLFCFKKNEDNRNSKSHLSVLILFLLIMQIAFLLQDNARILFLRLG